MKFSPQRPTVDRNVSLLCFGMHSWSETLCNIIETSLKHIETELSKVSK